MERKLWMVVLALFLALSVNAQSQLEAVPLMASDTFAIYKAKQQGEVAQQKGDLKEQSRQYDQIAFIYWEHNMFEMAAEWYKKSLALNQQLDNLSGISQINSNLGLIYSDLHRYETAYEYFQQTLAYRKMIKEPTGIISTLINISVVLNNLKRFDESIAALDEALNLAREMNDIEQMASCYGMLSETYEKANQPDKSRYYFEFYRSFHEKAQSEKEKATNEKLAETQLKLKLIEMEKANQELKLKLTAKELDESVSENQSLYKKYTKSELERSLLEKDNLLKESVLERQRLEQQRQRTTLIFLLALLLLIFGALVVFIRMYQQKRRMNIQISRQKGEIEAQKTSLTDSINYALRIQNAALKHSMDVDLTNAIDEFFVFFRSSAIVSGDFYWFNFSDDKLVLVAADCTGHGVPGAFMSLICMNLLNRIVDSEKVHMPDEILLRMNTAIIETLDQRNSNSFDGMDAAICTVDFATRKLHFSGAYRPLLIYNEGELTQVKGNMCSLGGSQERFQLINGKFDRQTFDIVSGMRFYMFSDGYCDQPNEDFKRIGTKQMNRLIAQTGALSMPEQHDAIEQFFYNWKKSAEQIDDVLVLGFSLK